MSRTWLLVCLLAIHIVSICGDEKVIGGHRAPPQRAPYLVSLMYDLKHYCGGTIINRRSILTAAHCVVNRRPNRMAVRAGSNYRMRGGYVASVTGWRRHSRFNNRNFRYDIAMVYLDGLLPSIPKIQPIRLFNGRLRTQKAIVVGWGSVRENGGGADNLQIAAIRVFRRRTCLRAYGRLLLRTMFCAGTMSGVRDTCQGDSGGPLVIQGRIAGVTSVGSGCGQRGYPGIYTRLPILKRWVIRNTRS
ncbi:trypsin-3-like [Hermetia illucens]|uniref:trypsin-3-like n=1 Tax=Hermetia illucens TaxID=343691 RepID=UPI0018CC1DDB|nr:trypsin-3-like [Hermetia illucens]